MNAKQVTEADIAACTHLNARTVGEKLKCQSVLNIRDFPAIARVLDVSPDTLIAAADSR